LRPLMSDDDFKQAVLRRLDEQGNKIDALTNSMHKMEIEQTKLKTKFGVWWVGLAALNVSGIDISGILSLFG